MPHSTNPLQSYMIASGYNVALGSLTNIENIKPTNDQYFWSPRASGLYNPGSERDRGDGTLLLVGFAWQYWEFGALTRAQLDYLRTTYCASGWSGKVTIYTTLGGVAYSRMNAVMKLPAPVDSDGAFYAYKAYKVKMTRLVASS